MKIGLRALRFIIYITSGTLLVIALCMFLFMRWLSDAVPVPDSERVYTVHKGQSLYSLARDLERHELLSLSKLWVFYARCFDKTKIKAGEYELDAFETPLSLLDKFNSAKVIQYKLTFVEGTTAAEAIKVISTHPKLEKTLPESISVSEPSALSFDIQHLEGWLYPDTYYYSAGDTDISILQRAHSRMKDVLNEEWLQRQGGLPIHDPYQALILASIVEKETGAPHERKDIAGVFIRRLHLGMRLQTDPTVIYGMGESYAGNITRADLRKATEYNTYVIDGLPPTPIALAGREALHAVLNPAEGSSLYFVAKGDGTHQFSATLQEHQRAVKQYQLNRKANYRSSYEKNE